MIKVVEPAASAVPNTVSSIIPHRHSHGFPLPHQHHQALGTGHTRVEQVALQKHMVLGQERHDHGGKLAALGLSAATSVRGSCLVERHR